MSLGKICTSYFQVVEKNSAPKIKDLYPLLNEEQLKEAEEDLDGYLEAVWQIYQRIRSDPAAYARFKALTGARMRSYDEELKVEKN